MKFISLNDWIWGLLLWSRESPSLQVYQYHCPIAILKAYLYPNIVMIHWEASSVEDCIPVNWSLSGRWNVDHEHVCANKVSDITAGFANTELLSEAMIRTAY